MPKQDKGGAVAPVEDVKGTDLAVTGGYEGDAGAGFEDTTAEDYALPMLGILQKMSPQVDKDQDAHIAGAEAGMVFNTVTQDMYDGSKGIQFIPVHREHKYVEWIPREAGGGLVAVHDPDSPSVLRAKQEAGGDRFAKLSVGNNQLAETFYVYGLLVDEDGSTTQVVIPFASTQIKAYKAWMTKARGIKIKNPDGRVFPAPMFAHVYQLTTHLQENNKGKWHGWRIGFKGGTATSARIGPEGDPLYDEARALREMVVRGVAKADIRSSQPLSETPISAEDEF
jgi:hypothetical protein